MTTARLIVAIISTAMVEAAFVAIWRWVLPKFGIEIPLVVLIAVMIAWAIFAVADFWFVTRILKKQAIVGLPTMIRSKGKVATPLAPEGFIRIKSELWGATSTEGNINTGKEVTVVDADGLKLIVRRSEGNKSREE